MIVLAVYTVGLIVISSFHELTFDETQAWLIAKSASYKDILTYIPHYEGHPPLWHLILSVFAKSGAPVDLSLKAVNITFCTAAMALLIFRSPFPKAVRFILPFTYYFFYQYGVVSRPYSLTMLAVFLAAITYKERNKKPFLYISSLSLLCLTTAYGIILSGGLCIVWSAEIIWELKKNKKLFYFWKDKRFYSLSFILALALALILMLRTADDCYYLGVEKYSLLGVLLAPKNYLYLFIYPFESWSGVLIGIYGIHDKMSALSVLMTAEVIIGLLIWVSFVAITAKNKKMLTFILPYGLLCGFMAFRYNAAHHLGIGALFHVFIFWIMAEQENGMVLPEFFGKLKEKITSTFIRKLTKGVALLVCLAPVLYSAIASFNDIIKLASVSCLAETIKENHLDDKKIMVKWQYVTEDEAEKEGAEDGEGSKEDDKLNNTMNLILQLIELPSPHDPIKEHRTYLCGYAAVIQPYFDHNIFMNYNVDCPDDLYMHYKYKEDSEAVFEKVREKGLPDFVIGYCPLDEIYDEETLKDVKYLPIQLLEQNNILKADTRTSYVRLYMREDLFDEYPQFHWIDDPEYNHY